MPRVGAIDCGTNSIRLLIADVEVRDGAAPVLTDVVREMDVVRLGYGVDRTGRIDPAAMERTLAAADRYAKACREHDVSGVRFVATSASRDASNAAEFIDGVRAAFADFGIAPEVISGAEEAELSFTGATGDVVAAGHPGPYLVCDIGGGSTEVVRGGGPDGISCAAGIFGRCRLRPDDRTAPGVRTRRRLPRSRRPRRTSRLPSMPSPNRSNCPARALSSAWPDPSPR